MLALMLTASCDRMTADAPASRPAIAESPALAPIAPTATEAPAGDYRLDKSHASLVFRVDHIGYSDYTGSFDDFDATLTFNPASPEKMSVVATIDVGSLDIPAPPDGFLDELKGPSWLNAVEFPAMTFRSTSVSLTGPDAARIDGELDFRGVKAPLAFDATFNGGYKDYPPYDPNARIGFSAKGSLKRSVYGILIGIPTPEAPVGVGDDVFFEIEAEFTASPEQQTTPPAGG